MEDEVGATFRASDTGCPGFVLGELLAGDYGAHFVFHCGPNGCDDGVLVGSSFFTSPAWHDWVDTVDVTCALDGRVLIAVEQIGEGQGDGLGLNRRREVSYTLVCSVSDSGFRCPWRVTTRVMWTAFGAGGEIQEQQTEVSSYAIRDGRVTVRGEVQQERNDERCTVWVGPL